MRLERSTLSIVMVMIELGWNSIALIHQRQHIRHVEPAENSVEGQKQCSCIAGIIELTPLSDCLSSSNHASVDGVPSKEWLSVKDRLIYRQHRKSYLSEILLSCRRPYSFSTSVSCPFRIHRNAKVAINKADFSLLEATSSWWWYQSAANILYSYPSLYSLISRVLRHRSSQRPLPARRLLDPSFPRKQLLLPVFVPLPIGHLVTATPDR